MTSLRATLKQALALHDAGRLAEAEVMYREILRMHPGQPDALNLLGVMATSVGHPETAIDLIRQAVARVPDEPDFNGNLAAACQAAGRVEEAVVHYRECIRLKPDYVKQYLFLADALLELGRFDEARERALEALAIAPDSALAYGTLGDLAGYGHYQFSDAEIRRVQELLDSGQQPAIEASVLAFTLANCSERTGQYDRAFAYYRQANDLKLQVYQQSNKAFDQAKHRALIDNLIAVFTPEFVERVRHFGIDSEVPVFIVGLVRSGSSLVEQILASHPEVHGAGERKDIDQLATDLHQQIPGAEKYPACLERLDPGLARSLAYGYLQRAARQAGGACRITDKMPHNYLHLGLIAMLFPRAKIIHCRRDPLDACASAYFQNFKWQPHAASLDDIAFHHQQYSRMMDHWRRVLPTPIHDVVYEELVANPEAKSRELIAYCGLPWDERCLDFHRTERVVQTASKLQVREPIHNRSVGRCAPFQAHLEPLRQALGLVARPSCQPDTLNQNK